MPLSAKDFQDCPKGSFGDFVWFGLVFNTKPCLDCVHLAMLKQRWLCKYKDHCQMRACHNFKLLIGTLWLLPHKI